MYSGYRGTRQRMNEGALSAIISMPALLAERIAATAGRGVAMLFVVASFLMLGAVAWLMGPLTPLEDWRPFIFGASLVGLAMLVNAGARVMAGDIPPAAPDLPTGEAAPAFFDRVVRAPKPITVCTHCRRELDSSEEDQCLTCRQRGSILRITGDRELRMLEALLFPTAPR